MHALAPQMLPQFSHPSHRPPPSNIGAIPTPPVTARKRKRQQFTVTYSEVQEVDSSGKVREVIVIDDTPPPSTVSPATTHTAMYSASYQPPVYSAPIRTRARAAAEAALSASTSSGITVAPAPKKRKRDPADDVGSIAKKVITNGALSNAIAANKSFAGASGVVADDVRTPFSCWGNADLSIVCIRRQRRKSHATTKRDTISSFRMILYIDDVSGIHLKNVDISVGLTCVAIDRTVRLLGQGTFGKVVEAVDTETNTRVAIKIIRAIPKYRDASKIEVRVLQKLKERDPLNRQ